MPRWLSVSVSMSMSVSVLVLGLVLAACDNTWSTAGSIKMGELEARCIEGDNDPADLLRFEAQTVGEVAVVEVDVRRGGTILGTVELFEQDPSFWSRETRVATLDTTCAEFDELHLFFRASGDDGSSIEVEY